MSKSGSNHRRTSSGEVTEMKIKRFPLVPLGHRLSLVSPRRDGPDRTEHGRSISLPSLPSLTHGISPRCPDSPERSRDDDSDIESYRSHLPDNFVEAKQNFLDLKAAALPRVLLHCQHTELRLFNQADKAPDLEIMSYLLILQTAIKKNSGLVYIQRQDGRLIPTMPEFFVFSTVPGVVVAKCTALQYSYCRHAYMSVLSLNSIDSFVRVLATNEERACSVATTSDFHISEDELTQLFKTGQVVQTIKTGSRRLTLFTLVDLLLLDFGSL